VNWRGFRAVVRLELVRGRRLILWGGALLLVMLVLAVALPEKLGIIAGIFALPVAMAIGMAPLGTLAVDKMQGHLEFDRTLPLSLPTIASARMLGATLRTAPAILGLVALGMAVAGDRPMAAPMVVTVACVAMLAGWWVLWILLGLNARFSMRRLWWVPLSLWLIPGLVPEPVLARMGNAIEAFGTRALDQLGENVGLLALLGIGGVVVTTLLLFSGAVALFASGLARYRPDPAALGVPLGAAPKRELAAIGRGPVVAVIRLRLRLALEQFRRELLIIAAMLVVILLDLEPIADYARLYLPILAALIPSGIAFHLMAGRATGAIEGLQQLPHPRRVIGVGHLVAVLVMACPGVLVIAVARAMEDTPMDPTALAMRWLWYVTLGWFGVVLAVWATRVRLAVVGVLLLGVVAVWWLLDPGAPLTDRILGLIATAKTIRTDAGLALPLGAALLSVIVGLELFARGLATFRSGDR
jgi:hypothetical protein